MANTIDKMSKLNPFGKLRIDTERGRSIKTQNSKRAGLPRKNAFATRTRSIREQLSSVRGYSIIELLVVLSVFSVIAIIATQSIVLTLRGSRKGESLITVRENLDFAFGVMERHIRGAKSIETCSNTKIQYLDAEGTTTDFSCLVDGDSIGYIASGSARLTSTDVNVNCSGTIFNCPTPAPGVPPTVIINVTASDKDSSGVEGAQITTSTRILLRTY